jgi:hypothetical protein
LFDHFPFRIPVRLESERIPENGRIQRVAGVRIMIGPQTIEKLLVVMLQLGAKGL